MEKESLDYLFRQDALLLNGAMTSTSIEYFLVPERKKGGSVFEETEAPWKEALDLMAFLLNATDERRHQKGKGASLGEETADAQAPFILDVSGIHRWDSAGLAALMELLELIQEKRGPVKLVGLSSFALDLIEVYKLKPLLAPYLKD